VFGSSGGANFLTKMTAVCAFIFFANSLTLAYMSSQSDSRACRNRAKKAVDKKARMRPRPSWPARWKRPARKPRRPRRFHRGRYSECLCHRD